MPIPCLPKMVLLDYGGTLAIEEPFDGVRGTRAVLKYCTNNPQSVTAQEIEVLARRLNGELGRTDAAIYDNTATEAHNHSFLRYLYGYFGLEFSRGLLALEHIFWDAAAPAQPADYAPQLLRFLREHGIRSGIISNISNSGDALRHRIKNLFPDHSFEMVLASSDYLFRKPHPMLFALALRMAGLPAQDILFCGDNVHCDVLGAHNAGMFPVWYRYHCYPEKPKPAFDALLIRDWRELEEEIKAFLPE